LRVLVCAIYRLKMIKSGYYKGSTFLRELLVML
jgi:hypothetical protein